MEMIEGFGIREFQLWVLLCMDFPGGVEHVSAALETLGSSREEMRAWGDREQAIPQVPVENLTITIHAAGESPTSHPMPTVPCSWLLEFYTSVLGDPVCEGLERRRKGMLGHRLLRWSLPLWPELWFEVAVGADGLLASSTRLVRRDDMPAVMLRDVTDLRSWSTTLDDIDRCAFGPTVDSGDNFGPGNKTMLFTAPDRRGRYREYYGRFGYDLLLEVGRA
ncbi:hypothetical protein GCM10023196_021420 [Actinoallomurus vinaceus]|uniref:Uncharacterized protein n=1 Tax=Actinoallomurus vinaceus TaxID=1080074 RepID=A0ABP8U4L0_9ACTN